jgi:hypothetical protein
MRLALTGVDRGHTVGSPLALEECGDPPVPVSWSRVDKSANIGRQFQVAVAGLRSAFRPHALGALGDVRAGEATLFIGNRPAAQSATARSLFLPSEAGPEKPIRAIVQGLSGWRKELAFYIKP